MDNNSLGDYALPATNTIFNAIESVENIEAIWDLLFAYTETLKLSAFSYYHLAPVGAFDADNYYFSCRGKNLTKMLSQKSVIFEAGSSFLHAMRSFDHPYSLREFSELGVLNEAQLALLTDTHFENSEGGLLITAHGPNGRSGCFVFETLEANDTLTAKTIRELNWVAEIAHLKYSQFRKSQGKSIKQLTSREQQILAWVARGKSNSVIADIIGISQHTVNGYLRSIYLKTGTSDRTTAALRGIGDGLINL